MNHLPVIRVSAFYCDSREPRASSRSSSRRQLCEVRPQSKVACHSGRLFSAAHVAICGEMDCAVHSSIDVFRSMRTGVVPSAWHLPPLSHCAHALDARHRPHTFCPASLQSALARASRAGAPFCGYLRLMPLELAMMLHGCTRRAVADAARVRTRHVLGRYQEPTPLHALQRQTAYPSRYRIFAAHAVESSSHPCFLCRPYSSPAFELVRR